MHIVFCIASLVSGGAERALSDLANHYAEKGHAVSILTLVSPDTQPFYFLDARINVIQINKSRKGNASILKRIYNVLSSFLTIRKNIKNLNPDMIVSFIDLMNVRILLACWGLGIPIIVAERTDPAHHRLPLKSLSEWLRLKLYPQASHVVVQTQAAAGYFPGSLAKMISVIPNVVKRPNNTKQSDFGKIKKIITVGRLSEEKNHQSLIVAFAEWLKQYPDLTLSIYGEGPERQKLEENIQKLSLQNKVMLPGATKDIQAALIEADFFVFPSRYEGFPNALCEAMAVGLPVVASHCSGNAEVVHNGVNGLLFPVGDMPALTQAVLGLLANPSQCAAFSKNATTIVDRYGPEKVYGLWDKLILTGVQ